MLGAWLSTEAPASLFRLNPLPNKSTALEKGVSHVARGQAAPNASEEGGDAHK